MYEQAVRIHSLYTCIIRKLEGNVFVLMYVYTLLLFRSVFSRFYIFLLMLSYYCSMEA